MPGALAAALCGALAIQLFPFSSPAARAAWCWDSSPPKCEPPDDGGCEEGATIPHGTSCTPTCPAGKVPSCPSGNKPLCPPSAGGTCTGDIGLTPDWWAICGFSQSCAANFKIGSAAVEDFGTFECKDEGSNDIVACTGTVEAPEIEDTGPIKDGATFGLLAGFVVLLIVGAILGRLKPGKATQALFRSGSSAWNLGNYLGIFLVVAALIAYLVGLAAGKSTLETVFITGLAAGCISPTPIFWAYFRAGAHSFVAMSREAAWRIHIVLGVLTLVFGIVHGAFVFAEDTIDVGSNPFWIMGFWGLILMIVGVVPAALANLKIIHYDIWKLLHFISMIGYVLACLHMMDHAIKLATPRSIAVAAVNLLALALFILQKVFTKCKAGKGSVQHLEVVEEPSGKHVFLRLQVPGFQHVPGKWGYLNVPSVSSVPHPFTLVPHEEDKEVVQFFIKVSGKFTKGLANCNADNIKVRVEGPFGEPPLPTMKVDAVVFVLGGVGVTPALSLAKEGRKMCGADRVCIYWAVRSLGLLTRCAPMLEPEINERLSCIRIDGAGPLERPLPIAAQEGRADVAGWLANTGADLASSGVKSVLLFCCGPPSLSKAAQAATAQALGVDWHVHVEQFLFLPQMGGGGRRRPQAKTPPSVVGRPAN